MKRGFLNKSYASGAALGSETSPTPSGARHNTQAGPSGSHPVNPSSANAASPTPEQVKDWLLQQRDKMKREDIQRTEPKQPPSTDEVVAEMARRLNSNGGSMICTSLPIAGDEISIVLFFDQQSKLRLTSQLVVLENVQRVNLLSECPSSYQTGGSMTVAQRAAQPGDVILREFPLVCLPQCYPTSTSAANSPKFMKLEDTLAMVINTLRPAARLAYRSLCNAWNGYTGPDPRGQGVLTGIYNTNAYPLEGLPSDDKIDYSGVFPSLSRINHSCVPNAHPKWNSRTLTIEVRALRPIRAGEEVTITYVPDMLLPSAQRRAFLREAYHFDCTCASCKDPVTSDARRTEIRMAPRPLRNDLMHWAGNKELVGTHPKYADEFLLARSKRICELYEREQLVERASQPGEWTHMDVVASCYLALGKTREAAFWTRKVHARNLATFQDDPPELALALRDVTSAPIWNMRQKAAEILASCS